MPQLIVSPPLSLGLTSSREALWDYVLANDAGELMQQGTVTTNLLPKTGAQSVSLLIPSTHLSWHSVRLPSASAKQLRAALIGSLEDQLLDEPDALHFAVSPDAANALRDERSFETVVCDKTWLQKLCDNLQAANYRIGNIVPELPITPDLAQHTLQGLPLSTDAPRWQELLRACEAAKQSGWTLSQFEFRPQSRWNAKIMATAQQVLFAPEWRWSRYAVWVLVIGQIVGLNVWAWRDRAALSAKREQVNKILLQSFPQTPLVVDAPLQMQRNVQQLRSNQGALSDKDLETQLAKLADTGGTARQIDYANGQLKVQP